MSRALEAACRTPWAITRDQLELVLEIAARENDDVEAIERRLGRPLANTREVRVRDGVAVIPVTGPLFRYANVFTRLSRATSFEELATDFGEALASPDVRAIVLEVDSPGGQVNGTQETAELIFRAREEKPVVAFVSGQGQSGGIWIASAAAEVVAGATAILGSIGTVLTVTDARRADEQSGVRTLEIVSSQTPRKRLDPFSDAGRAELQELVDAMADVFVDTLARNRGVSRERVLADFGQGGSFVGEAAVAAGLADRVGTLEDVIADLSGRGASRRSFAAAAVAETPPQKSEGTMPGEAKQTAGQPPVINRAYLDQHHADLVAQIRGEGREEGLQEGREAGASAERERILGIHGIKAQGFDELKSELMADPKVSKGDAALRILNAQSEREEQRRTAHLDARKADEEGLKDLATTSTGEGGAAAEEAKAAEFILSAGKKPKAENPKAAS